MKSKCKSIVNENFYAEFWLRGYFFLAAEHGDWLQGKIPV